jgi:hypothetical protein
VRILNQFWKRLLKLDDKYIKWDHFKQAYMWDISTNPFPIHQTITRAYLFITRREHEKSPGGGGL